VGAVRPGFLNKICCLRVHRLACGQDFGTAAAPADGPLIAVGTTAPGVGHFSVRIFLPIAENSGRTRRGIQWKRLSLPSMAMTLGVRPRWADGSGRERAPREVHSG